MQDMVQLSPVCGGGGDAEGPTTFSCQTGI